MKVNRMTADVLQFSGGTIPSHRGEFRFHPEGLQAKEMGEWVFFASRIEIIAKTRSENREDYGLLLRVYAGIGEKENFKEWIMPMELLAGDGKEYRAKLLSLGAILSPTLSGRLTLAAYFSSVIVRDEIISYSKIGWTTVPTISAVPPKEEKIKSSIQGLARSGAKVFNLADFLSTEISSIGKNSENLENSEQNDENAQNDRFVAPPSSGNIGMKYVRSDLVIPGDNARIGDKIGRKDFGTKGNFERWKEGIRELCPEGEYYEVFTLAAGLSGIFLNPLKLKGCGFHFQGESSTGKTTLLQLAASLWGGEEFICTWRTTDNAMESLAMNRNDGLLCLDEISMVAPHVAGQIAYMLANGEGKSRLKKTGEQRDRNYWNLIFLSSGETGLEGKIAENDALVMHAGQEMRVLNVLVDNETGIVLNAGSIKESGIRVREIQKFCKENYGFASIEAIKSLIADWDGGIERVRELMWEFMNGMEKTHSVDRQSARGVNNFALVAAVGEWAIEKGIFPFKNGESFKATGFCVGKYLESIRDFKNTEGEENERRYTKEQEGYLEQIHHVINEMGHLFEVWEFGVPVDMKLVKGRIGFVRDSKDGKHWYIYPTAWKRIMKKKSDYKEMAKFLLKIGVLQGKDGSTDVVKLPGQSGYMRIYHVTPEVMKTML